MSGVSVVKRLWVVFTSSLPSQHVTVFYTVKLTNKCRALSKRRPPVDTGSNKRTDSQNAKADRPKTHTYTKKSCLKDSTHY